MSHVAISSTVTSAGMKRLAPNHLWELAARLFRFRADRWRRRALFYRRYRDYFPRLSGSRFVDRCWELETMYRGLSEVMHAIPRHEQWVPVREMVVRRKHSRKTALPYQSATLSMR
jgi:hypothetical protein